ncbi:MAG: hypothetical protein ACFFD2_11670 [Promethearchaeota archaeon]
MPSRKGKIGGKPCPCPKENFIWVEKIFHSQKGPFINTHTYEIRECSTHHYPWGKRRNEVIRITSAAPLEGYAFNEHDIEFFKLVFSRLWNGKINEKAWHKELAKIFRYNDVESKTKRFIQIGLICREEIVLQSRIEKKSYILLTDRGKSELKYKLQFKTVEEVVNDCKNLIVQTLDEMEDKKLSNAQIRIKSVLEDQVADIEKGEAGLYQSNEKRIVPSISLKKRPVYEIIIRSLCTWLKIWKPVVTVRELSARAVKDIALVYTIDPSKLLEKHLKVMDDIMKHYCSRSLESLGLMHLLKFFNYSGDIAFEISSMEGQVFKTVTNYYLSRIINGKMATPACQLICIENLSAFFHVSEYTRLNEPKDWLVVYIGGMPDDFLPSVVLRLIKVNNFKNIYFWLDNDLGGLQIFEYFLNYFENQYQIPENLSALYKIPPTFLKHTYRKDQDVKLMKLMDKTSFPVIKEIAEYIVAKGSIEQEVFLSNFDEFLKFNTENSK